MLKLKNRVTISVQCFRVTLPPPLCTLDLPENPISRVMHKSNRLLSPTLHLLRLLSRFIQSRQHSCSLTFLKKRLSLTLRLKRSVPLFPSNPRPPLTEELPRHFLPLPLKMP